MLGFEQRYFARLYFPHQVSINLEGEGPGGVGVEMWKGGAVGKKDGLLRPRFAFCRLGKVNKRCKEGSMGEVWL